MAQVKTISVHVGRKVVADYQSREVSLGVEVELEAGEDPREVVDRYTLALQNRVDAALHDGLSPHSFGGSRPAPPTRIWSSQPPQG